MRALTMYWSKGGNTRKVAEALHSALTSLHVSAIMQEIKPSLEVSYYEHDLVLLGAPVYQFLPPEPVQEFLKRQQRQTADIRPAAPEKKGHYGVVFCTYGGPHTGVREAIPALKYMGQFLEHAGVPVVEEWPVVGQFHDPARERLNRAGRLGDIHGRPNQNDLNSVTEKLRGLLRRLKEKLPARGAGSQKG